MTFKFLTLGDHVRLLETDFGPRIAASVADSAGVWGYYTMQQCSDAEEQARYYGAKTAATVAFNAYPMLRER